MPSDSVASFLDLARESRLLGPDQFDDLFRQPDVPQSNLAALCDFLVARKVLTPYQAGMIRTGHGYELSFAGYPVYEDLGPCPGGQAYRVAHPSLRTPLVLRRVRAEWLAPADNVAAYVQRAQAAGPAAHPNLIVPLDAGVHRDEPFVVLDPIDGADLQTLISDIGPMPVSLALEYLRQATRGLEAAHTRALVHGDLRPQYLAVGPLMQSSKLRPDGSPRYRPTASATVRIAEFGLIPRRPDDFESPKSGYYPPEGIAEPTTASDMYQLGGCLFFLLTGREPGGSSLVALRPDTLPSILGLHAEMTAIDPTSRPTATQLLARLEALTQTARSAAPVSNDVELVQIDGPTKPLPRIHRSEIVPSEANVELVVEPAGGSFPGLSSSLELPAAPASAPGGWAAYSSTPAAPPTPPAFGEWMPTPFVPASLESDRSAPGYDPVADGATVRRTPRPPAPGTRKKLWMWLGIGLALQVIAVIIWIVLLSGNSEPETEPKKEKKANPAKVKKTT